MKEATILGDLLPSHPDLVPIIEAIRAKYGLVEVPLDGDPIEEIFLNDEPVRFEEFRNDIKAHLLENLDFLPPDFIKQYKASKSLAELKTVKNTALLPKYWKEQIKAIVDLMKNFTKPIYQLLDAHIDSIADMLYVYILTGETREAPSDWFGKVATIKNPSGDAIVFAMASQAADPEVVVNEFRAEYRKNFGEYRPKITKTAVDTAYYLQLKKNNKPWNYIVEQYILLSGFDLPKDRTSKRYGETYRMYEQRLKKRMQRTEKILDVILGDKK